MSEPRGPVCGQDPNDWQETLPPLTLDTVVGWDPCAAHLELENQIFCARGARPPQPVAGPYAQLIRRLVAGPASLREIVGNLPLLEDEVTSFVAQMVGSGFLEIRGQALK